MTDIISPCTDLGRGAAKPTSSSQTTVVSTSEERSVPIIFRLQRGDDATANLQLASRSLFYCRNEIYSKFQEREDFWTQTCTIVWRTASVLMKYTLVVDIPKTPSWREFLLPYIQNALNPVKTRDTSNVIQYNRVVAIRNISEDISIKVQKALPREYLMKPSSTIKLEEVGIPDHAIIQGSIIPCVTDIETGEVSTKGHFIVQLMGRALQEFSQNHRIIKFKVGVMVADDKNYGSEVVPSSSPDSSASITEKTESFSIRNKKGQLRCLIDLICHDDLLRINQSKINLDITYSIVCQLK